jgi:hypothetical protein
LPYVELTSSFFSGRIIASDDGRMRRGNIEMEETQTFLLSSYLDSASPLSILNSVDAVTTTLPSSLLLLLFLPSVEQGGGKGQWGLKSDDRIKLGILPFYCSMVEWFGKQGLFR